MTTTAVLFDLDGTLIDTAPDMAASLNHILEQEGYPGLALETIRPHVSQGGLALTRLGFDGLREESEIESLRLRFLDHYLQNIAINSRLFDGFDEVLEKLENQGIKWGVVTNKPGWLTDPLMQQLNLDKRSAVTISGDTTAEKKPHPLPMTTAAKAINRDCEHCIYVGDDPRDIQAGKAANMTTVIAKYGYITDPDNLSHWQADHIIESPVQLLSLLNRSDH
jgi:phosphoglycolate phosphatase